MVASWGPLRLPVRAHNSVTAATFALFLYFANNHGTQCQYLSSTATALECTWMQTRISVFDAIHQLTPSAHHLFSHKPCKWLALPLVPVHWRKPRKKKKKLNLRVTLRTQSPNFPAPAKHLTSLRADIFLYNSKLCAVASATTQQPFVFFEAFMNQPFVNLLQKVDKKFIVESRCSVFCGFLVLPTSTFLKPQTVVHSVMLSLPLLDACTTLSLLSFHRNAQTEISTTIKRPSPGITWNHLRT